MILYRENGRIIIDGEGATVFITNKGPAVSATSDLWNDIEFRNMIFSGVYTHEPTFFNRVKLFIRYAKFLFKNIFITPDPGPGNTEVNNCEVAIQITNI